MNWDEGYDTEDGRTLYYPETPTQTFIGVERRPTPRRKIKHSFFAFMIRTNQRVEGGPFDYLWQAQQCAEYMESFRLKKPKEI